MGIAVAMHVPTRQRRAGVTAPHTRQIARGDAPFCAANRRAGARARRTESCSLGLPVSKENLTMPQSAQQQNKKAGERQRRVSEPTMKAAAKPTEDHVYGLVSVLYHALQGAQTYEKYIEDAQKA